MDYQQILRSTLRFFHVDSLWTATISSVILWIMVTIIYNLYLHPLRKYPGPLLARATGWWYIYHLCNGTQGKAFLKAHHKYGDVVRVGPNDLDYTDPQAWNDIYGHRSGHEEKENSKDKREIIQESPERDIIVATRHEHSFLRRLIAHGFSDKALREQQPTIHMYIDQLIQGVRLRAEKGSVVDLADWYSFLMFDIIGHLVYSESFESLQGEQYHPWVHMIETYVTAAAFIFSAQRLGILGSLFWKLVPKKFRSSRPAHHELVHQKLLRRLETTPTYTDLSTRMIEAYEKGELSVADLSVNTRVLVTAGAHTTTTLVIGATYYVAGNPKIYTRVMKEIRQAFNSENEINLNTISEKLPYFTAVLQETLRMYPPGAGRFSRITPEPEGAVLCGQHVPGGVSVGITHYAMYHYEGNFHRAGEFLPERWLDEESKQWSSDRKEALQPFGYGPRNCVGRNLANIKSRLILARMFWNFDIELTERPVFAPHQRNIYVVWERMSLPVKLTPVARTEKPMTEDSKGSE